MSSVNSGDSNGSPGYDSQPPGAPLSSYVPGQVSLLEETLGAGVPGGWDEGDGPELFEFDDRSIPLWRLYAMRFLAVIPITLGGILLFDAVFAKPLPDRAVVSDMRSGFERPLGRSQRGPRGISIESPNLIYTVDATGSRDYSNGVSRAFYQQVKTGDTLRLKTTPLLGHWREATLVRNGNTVAEYRSKEAILWGVLACALIIVPAIAFAEPHVILRLKEMQHVITVVELVAVCGCLFLGLRLAGLD